MALLKNPKLGVKEEDTDEIKSECLVSGGRMKTRLGKWGASSREDTEG